MSSLSNKKKALISMCLIGVDCRYNHTNCLTKYLNIYKEKYILIPVCPEQLAGFSTPRSKCEIKFGNGFDVINGKSYVFNENGDNVTAKFMKGAEEVLKICNILKIKYAFFKEKSPSCGVSKIYNNGKIVNGCGVTTALLLKNKIKVFGVE